MLCNAQTTTLFFFLMIRRPPRSTLSSSSAASDVYKRQIVHCVLTMKSQCSFESSENVPNKLVRVRLILGELRTRAATQLASDSRARLPNLSLIHISEPTRLLSISYAVFCLKKKKNNHTNSKYKK
eukprot:TRINITY_DN21525_c0_g1_i1.p1 TRINITY_DN21525_c0_g1~~TRINITY_DN21525_c0_g1_i1.p1  ORF type:complete len:126 (-),score=22.39 TRINITY_DN21525_c0_g1_i1:65-442(-)